MAFTSLDLFARLLLIERKDALQWGVDPAADPAEIRKPKPMVLAGGARSVESLASPMSDIGPKGADTAIRQIPSKPEDDGVVITPLDVLLKLMTSPRALACIFSTFVYG